MRDRVADREVTPFLILKFHPEIFGERVHFGDCDQRCATLYEQLVESGAPELVASKNLRVIEHDVISACSEEFQQIRSAARGVLVVADEKRNRSLEPFVL